MKETWLMICDGYILDKCSAESKEEANKIFKQRNSYMDWSESDILSEEDYRNEIKLKVLESQK